MNLVILIQETPLFMSVYRKLRSFVEIVPYYLVEERLLEPSQVDVQPRLWPLEIRWLSAEDMKAIVQKNEVRDSIDDLQKRIKRGCRCLALMYGGELAAYTWCDLKICQGAPRKFSFSLQPDEAYLFDARTFRIYRGQRLAPFLRYQLYRELVKTDRRVFYSYTLFMNTSSNQFKKKLGATPIALLLSVGFLNRWYTNIVLRRYDAKRWSQIGLRVGSIRL